MIKQTSILIWCLYKGLRMVPRKRGSRKILAGSRNLGSVFDKSRSLVFAWFVFTFFESRNFLPKSLGLGFLTGILASRRVSDFTIRHPFYIHHSQVQLNHAHLYGDVKSTLEKHNNGRGKYQARGRVARKMLGMGGRKRNNSLRGSSAGRSGGGREKEGELATSSLEFEFHLHFLCGSLSTELSDFRQSARSGNENKCKQILKNTFQG